MYKKNIRIINFRKYIKKIYNKKIDILFALSVHEQN